MSLPPLAWFCLAAAAGRMIAGTAAAAVAAPERTSDGIVLPVGEAWLKVEVRGEDILRVAFARDRAFFSRPSLAVLPPAGPPPAWELSSNATHATVATARLRAVVELATGGVRFLDPAGKVLLAEKTGSRALEPAPVQGEPALHVAQAWEAGGDESLYGLGQMQLGVVDLAGLDLDLWQRNTVVVVPFLVSSRGYGILWDNPSFTKFGDRRPFGPIPADCLIDANGRRGGLTSGTYAASRGGAVQNTATTANLTLRGGGARRGGGPRITQWMGEIAPPATGDYQFQTYANGAVRLWLDGQLLIDHWRQNWLPEYDQVKVRLEAGRTYSIRLEGGGEQGTTLRLLWKTPNPDSGIALWSEAGEGVDYYFVQGPGLANVIAGYRRLTGAASLMPRWAFGLWQSRQRYETAQQLLDAVEGFRSRRIPFDNIVQDWQYWPRERWGTHEFDPARFPDPAGMIRAVHAQHARLMISVWPKFYPGHANFDAMQAGGFLYQPTLQENTRDWLQLNYAFYDAFNPAARELFWRQLGATLFQQGVDAWWMDATEPDVVQPSPPTLETQQRYMGRTALGPAARVLNAYALVNSQAVYEGQREAAPDRRVFILTRSAFAGQQRFASAVWSGDVTSTWSAMRKQVAAGLGLSLSGLPYWTMDVGGYTMQSRFSTANPSPAALEEWRELNVRWFQFGTFTPLLRVHGEQQPREMWTFGGEEHPAYQAQLKSDRLRYRLLPYIYSVAGAVTHENATFLRPLVMDFPGDAAARRVADEYLFGPALLVAPVTEYQARSRPVVLPAGPRWYDFWSGAMHAGGQTYEAPAPYDATPVFVRAGSIVPFGPELQHTGEKPADPVTLYIYAGADGEFTLYEDDGLTYGYEKGAFSRIPLRWNDAARTLTLGWRTGAFPGMLAERVFDVVLVSPESPVGFSFEPTPVRSVRYRGEPLDIVLAPAP